MSIYDQDDVKLKDNFSLALLTPNECFKTDTFMDVVLAQKQRQTFFILIVHVVGKVHAIENVPMKMSYSLLLGLVFIIC